MSDQRQIVAVLGVSAAIGLGAWLYLRSKKKAQDEPEPDPFKTGASYDRRLSAQFAGGDRGYGISALQYDASGNAIEDARASRGAAGYRYGDTVTANRPEFFGAQSYRATICVPMRSRPYTVQASIKLMYGQARAHDVDNPGHSKWQHRQFLSGSGWDTNGAALVAKSWSCDLSKTQGQNNLNCFNRRNTQNTNNLGRLAGGLGFFPFDKVYTSRWMDNEGDAVPFIEYAGAHGAGRPGERTYADLVRRPRTEGVNGFLDTQGALWIAGHDALNFSYISDEDPNVIYYFSMTGASGEWTAMNRLTHQFVPRRDLRPRWGTLTHNTSYQFVRSHSQYEEKIDPWSIPDSPWNVLDRMQASSYNVEGIEYNVNYARRSVAFLSVASQGGQRIIGGDIPSYIRYKNDHLMDSRKNWPIVSYGLINPWRDATGSRVNGMPFDFAMPIWMHKLNDMPFKEMRFDGDLRAAPTTVYNILGA